MKLLDAQKQSMLETRRARFLNTFAAYVTSQLPVLAERTAREPTETTLAAIRRQAAQQLPQALSYGLDEPEDVARYLLYALAHGADFVTRRPSLQAVIEAPDISPAKKLQYMAAYYG